MRQRTDNDAVAMRGKEARQVLDNPAYQAAMKALHEQIVQQWGECPIRDTEGQRLLLQLKKLAVKFESTLAAYVEAGRMAQHAIDVEDERNESGARKLMRRIL